jgi:hypothetical protein
MRQPASFKPFQSDMTGCSDAQQQQGLQPPIGIIPSQLSAEFPLDVSNYMARRKFNSFTVPNPNTAALSELLDAGSPSHYGTVASTQDDLAHIASNFSSEQQPDLLSDHELRTPSTPTHGVRQSSPNSPFSIEAIKALIDRSAGGPKSKNDLQHLQRLQQIMEAGIEKLRESAYSSVTATTSSSSPSLVSSTLASQAASTSIRQHPCTQEECQKTYSRPCDLKKHMKRHHRPYGCTFDKCYERFGSKYDWKRHENTQHFQPECWKCEECSVNGESSMFFKKKIYVSHLEHKHRESRDSIKDHLKKQRLGRDRQTTFWCGFCKRIIDLNKKGIDGMDERFNHVDEHFKQQRDIRTWVECDSGKTKGQRQESAAEVERGAHMPGSDGGSGGGQSEVDRDDDDDDDDEDDEVDELLGHGAGRYGNSDAAGGSGDGGGGGGSNTITTTPVRNNQKRPLASDIIDFSSSSLSSPPSPSYAEYPPAKKQRGDLVPAMFIICHECQNLWLVEHGGQTCLMCQHRACSACKYMADSVENDQGGSG